MMVLRLDQREEKMRIKEFFLLNKIGVFKEFFWGGFGREREENWNFPGPFFIPIFLFLALALPHPIGKGRAGNVAKSQKKRGFCGSSRS